MQVVNFYQNLISVNIFLSYFTQQGEGKKIKLVRGATSEPEIYLRTRNIPPYIKKIPILIAVYLQTMNLGGQQYPCLSFSCSVNHAASLTTVTGRGTYTLHMKDPLTSFLN